MLPDISHVHSVVFNTYCYDMESVKKKKKKKKDFKNHSPICSHMRDFQPVTSCRVYHGLVTCQLHLLISLGLRFNSLETTS